MNAASRRKVFVIAGISIAIILASIFSLVLVDKTGGYEEVGVIGKGVQSFQELSDRFKVLANDKGGAYAYGVLRLAELPPNTDLHLLGHTIGEELYKQNGPDGIADCTPEFRNACSHAIVIGTLNEYGGTKALSLIEDACSRAPGGSGAYTMCYHGLGHGVFAYFGYDLKKTTDFCKKTGTVARNNREYQECVGGSIMELMGGGGHDHELWLEARDKYYDSKDPLAPCSSSVIPEDAKGMCYVYISPHLFEVAGADLALPQPPQFSKAFEYCDGISKKSPQLRQACFGGIGKEFPVLAMMRDIRNVADATDEQISLMHTWCALAPHQEAHDACAQSILASLFWGGENNPKAAVRFCSLADIEERQACFHALFLEAGQYVSLESVEGASLCEGVPVDFTKECHDALSV